MNVLLDSVKNAKLPDASTLGYPEVNPEKPENCFPPLPKACPELASLDQSETETFLVKTSEQLGKELSEIEARLA